jgi:methyltransferase (TIGR00027 family)
MESAQPSRTALHVALRRASHQLYDERPLVFDDPLAVAILGPHAEKLGRTPGRNPFNKPRPYSVSLRAFLVVRSRYAEDLLAQAVQRGVTQYVLLGAGLDTFAHRNPYPTLRVFEVDHPSTQQWKRELLLSTGFPAPGKLTYVPVDFEHQALPEQLQAAGFDASAPTFFAWLGVVPYITLDAFRATVRFLSTRPHGSGVIFDYSQPRGVLTPVEQLAHDSLASRVQLAGEAFLLFFTPPQAASELAAFHQIEDIGSSEINARYFAQRSDGLKILGSAGRILSAWV